MWSQIANDCATGRIGKIDAMRVLSKSRLREFWSLPGRKDAAGPLKAWLAEADRAKWTSSASVTQQYPDARVLSDHRVAFAICAPKYRLVTRVNYDIGFVIITFVGTQAEYDRAAAAHVGGG